MPKFSKFACAMFFVCLCAPAFAQLDMHVVFFTDRNNSPFSIFNPQAFLSAKAIARRANQNIPVQSSDLPVNPAYIDSVMAKGALLVQPVKWFNAVIVQTQDSAVLAQISALTFVDHTSVVGRVARSMGNPEAKLKPLPHAENEPHGSTRLTHFDYGASFNQIHIHNGDLLHAHGYTGKGMVVAVIDAGFYKADSLPAFSDLWSQGRILGTRDFVDGAGVNVFDEHPHGMMVLSTMAGHLDGQLLGTAPAASYWLLRSERAATEYIIEEYNWAAAAAFADSAGADILTTSLGYTLFEESSQDHSYATMDGNSNPITIAADMAASKGILVVNSAGNEGNSPWNYISAAADGDSVLAVGAVNAAGAFATFSGKGPTFDGRIKPNVAAQGMAAVLASPSGGTFTGNGTSFSGPIIAGLAACLWQAHPTRTAMEIFKAIERSSSHRDAPDNFTGHGIPDFAYAHILLSGKSIVNPDLDEWVTVYPNPAVDNFSIDFYSATEQEVTIEVFNLLGERVFLQQYELPSVSYNSLKVGDATRWRNGGYVIRLQSEKETSYRRVIKL